MLKSAHMQTGYQNLDACTGFAMMIEHPLCFYFRLMKAFFQWIKADAVNVLFDKSCINIKCGTENCWAINC